MVKDKTRGFVMTDQPYTLVSSGREALLAEPAASNDRPQMKRIFQGLGTTIVRLTLTEGQVMREHSTNSPLTVQVLEGLIKFRIADDEVTMPTGAIIHVAAGVKHELEAVTESHMTLLLVTAL